MSAEFRIVSPCEHGVEHHITGLKLGAEFWVPECKGTRGKFKYHLVTDELYPDIDTSA